MQNCVNLFYVVLNSVNVKQCKKCDFYLGGRDFIMFLLIGQPNGPLQKNHQNMHPQLINMNL